MENDSKYIDLLKGRKSWSVELSAKILLGIDLSIIYKEIPSDVKANFLDMSVKIKDACRTGILHVISEKYIPDENSNSFMDMSTTLYEIEPKSLIKWANLRGFNVPETALVLAGVKKPKKMEMI